MLAFKHFKQNYYINISLVMFICVIYIICMSHVVDPQEGCVVVLPVESQKSLVQILHFLPAFPAELLACLSQVCNTGRVSASLATMLIRTIHLRYEGYDTSPCTNAVLKSASSVPLWGIRDLVSHGVQGMGVKSQGKKNRVWYCYNT